MYVLIAGQKRQGCGQCEACTKADCGKCRYCLDKKKFGGKERLKQRCIHSVGKFTSGKTNFQKAERYVCIMQLFELDIIGFVYKL